MLSTPWKQFACYSFGISWQGCVLFRILLWQPCNHWWHYRNLVSDQHTRHFLQLAFDTCSHCAVPCGCSWTTTLCVIWIVLRVGRCTLSNVPGRAKDQSSCCALRNSLQGELATCYSALLPVITCVIGVCGLLLLSLNHKCWTGQGKVAAGHFSAGMWFLKVVKLSFRLTSVQAICY